MNYFKITYNPILCHLYDVNEHFRWYIYNILFLHNLQNLSTYNVSYDFNMLTNLYNNKKIFYNLDNSVRFDCQNLSEYVNEKIEKVLKDSEKEFLNSIINSNIINNELKISTSPPTEYKYNTVKSSKSSELYHVIKYTLFVSLYANNNMCFLFVEIPIYSYIPKSIFQLKHLCEFDSMTKISFKKSKKKIKESESPTLKALNSTKSYFYSLIDKIDKPKLNQYNQLNTLDILKNLRSVIEEYEDNKHLSPDLTFYHNLFIMEDSVVFGGKKHIFSENYMTMFENSNLLMNTFFKVSDLNIIPRPSPKFKDIHDFKITSSELVEQNILSKISSIIPPISF